jgi:hypothetical protein
LSANGEQTFEHLSEHVKRHSVRRQHTGWLEDCLRKYRAII